MRTRLLAAAVFVGLFVMAILTGNRLGTAFGDMKGDGTCTTNNCKDIVYDSGDCVNGGFTKTCNFTQSKDNVTYCATSTKTCTIIQPLDPHSCTGSCQYNPAVGCTTTFNKCR
jgi:hypothetical protein